MYLYLIVFNNVFKQPVHPCGWLVNGHRYANECSIEFDEEMLSCLSSVRQFVVQALNIEIFHVMKWIIMDIYWEIIIQINVIHIEHQQLEFRVIWAIVKVLISGKWNPGQKYELVFSELIDNPQFCFLVFIRLQSWRTSSSCCLYQ